MSSSSLLVELFVEELPPKALKRLGESFASALAEQLRLQGLLQAGAQTTPYASPRRLAAHITQVLPMAADQAVQQKLMPVSVGLDAGGNATPALLKKLQALGADVSSPAAVVSALKRAPDGKAEALFYDRVAKGSTLAAGLQKALDEALDKLPIPKVMQYQLETDCELPGWSSVNFVRPAHRLLALHGDAVVPVKALGLTAGNTTRGHRFEAKVDPVVVTQADHYAQTLRADGAVIASFAERRAEIEGQLQAAATKVGGGVRPIEDEALLDEVTALVERPNVLICQFEQQFLEVPQECLILTMKANQKYFPLLDATGKLTHRFLVVSNISPDDASAVVYHNKLGSQGERTARVCLIARAIGQQVGGADLAAQAERAARLSKADLLTDMVGEFPELQGIMGGYYARHDGLSAEIAEAIEDHYKPRFAGDELPRNSVGVVVALADKLETLVGMFGIGNLPSGDKDPFALRRHALGVIRMLIERELALDLPVLLALAVPAFGAQIADPREVLGEFIYERLAGSLREQGYSAQEVEAVLALKPGRLADVARQLQAVRAFAALPESAALAAANKRIGNILKKAGEVDAHVNTALLQEEAEKNLYNFMQKLLPQSQALFEAGDYTASLQMLAALRGPVDAFFDDVMVNAEQMDLRLNRQGLLKSLQLAMNRVADLSRLAA